ncbi:SDR family oxidoreductase [Chryseobacterium sp. ISL-6]|uniref:SDR family NAD(P)-dependent oxidoreductase n=1 Tax=Chryseobacterium sp. ISL-6 TaxID=2819143 RepID=UPI001BE8CA56|nr:SDR family oxidoreductase [Chryseobacterium sp. ISL-6]MBT2622654.1 SDR family oxidoreductase [Chryseobacterium sp. ISL-6]
MSTKTKIALVTGGSRGLGKNIALTLAKKGIDVILTYHSNKSEADKVVSEIQSYGRNGLAMQLDTRKVDTFDTFIQQVSKYLEEKNGSSKFDFLINNAGTGLILPASQTVEKQLDELLDIHYKGVFFLIQKSLPAMNDGGSIINLSSGLTRTTMTPAPVYASMKGAIEVLTRYLAKELGPRKIRVNAIAPGAIETDFDGGMVRDNGVTNERIASATALGRVGLPDDIGKVAAFLCSEDSDWVTGERIEVSGGQGL